MDLKDKKCLIAYFSRKGNNYVDGGIKNLAVGNTEVAAEIIRKVIDGDIFCIDSVKEYPKDYTEATNVAKEELNLNARPNLSDKVENMEDYDVIILGYPNWWGTMPMPVFTFLEEYNFSGKTILPFCTHEGSGLGHSEKDIKKVCSNSDILSGLAIRGSSVNTAEKSIVSWLENNLSDI
ncbi:flavodoxin [Clostridium felsineum]|uniref:Flavodoxin-like domain-containing protein n=1 Tax=Clostridium felsineum TaxID=36839 RepID=A0A1S8L0Z0_9CLOT|nr:flavodoxin [Clostridium felsineum]URZ05547.1 hypothetical protein CLROS_008730 [Clostridium felsineum]URZ10586.1 hypothetical protein CROST_012960 [Clostridium felsineum]